MPISPGQDKQFRQSLQLAIYQSRLTQLFVEHAKRSHEFIQAVMRIKHPTRQECENLINGAAASASIFLQDYWRCKQTIDPTAANERWLVISDRLPHDRPDEIRGITAVVPCTQVQAVEIKEAIDRILQVRKDGEVKPQTQSEEEK